MLLVFNVFSITFTITFFVYSSAQALVMPHTNDRLVKLIEYACQPLKYICPKKEYGEFTGVDKQYKFNSKAIAEAPQSESIRQGLIPSRFLLTFIRTQYCCTEGPCLHRCGIKEIHEIDIIKDFPRNVDSLFSLDYPGMEEFRDPVYTFLDETDWKHVHPPFPAEIEEFFDFLHDHRHELGLLLHDAVLQKHLDQHPELLGF